MRKLITFIFVGMFIFFISSCEKDEKKDTTTPREDQFIVGLECAYAPFNWTTSKKTPTSYEITGQSGYCDGYDVKIARLIAVYLDKELVIKAYDWEGLIPALSNNSIDAIIAGMSPTEERKLSIDFSDVYFRSEQVVVVKKDGEFTDAQSINDFNGAKITAQTNTLQEGLITQLTGAIKATSLPDYSSLVTATSKETVDGFIAELPVAMQAVNNNKSLTYIQFSNDNGFNVIDEEITTAIGLRKEDPELKAQINEVLALLANETRNEWMYEFVNKE